MGKDMELLDMMLDMIAGTSERKKHEVKLLRGGTALAKKISDVTTKLAMDDSLSDEQIIRISNYIDLVESGFDTFLEQIKKEST